VIHKHEYFCFAICILVTVALRVTCILARVHNLCTVALRGR